MRRLLIGFGVGFFVACFLVSRQDKALLDEAFKRMTEAELRACPVLDPMAKPMNLEQQINRIRLEKGWPPVTFDRQKRTRPVG